MSEHARDDEDDSTTATTTSPAPLRVPASPTQQFPRGNGELLLLVDDDTTVRFVATKILTNYGYRVLAAENGAEGVSLYLARRDEIALVISDLMMPVMDGAVMIRRLVAINPDVRVIVVSGSIGTNSKVTPPEVGVLRILEKPYTTVALLQCVSAALAGVPDAA